ncbi:PstS family phosphate ABC transporter substrate-binding protein [Actinopolymorpha alba]|uniref:PstS family phosphate ABC transporter substrate-binding protein n=1 Tax=Actinopolymorpha alba TaxID=533267 RepID=UPI0003605F6D|nr:substrate-binding domain-containing protein [Actinopolymorpha alba]
MQVANTGPTTGIDPEALARARNLGITARAKQRFYTKKFDLSGLPTYQPKHRVRSPIRQWGDNYYALSGLMDVWEKQFRTYHPQATFEDNLSSSAVAFPGLIAGVADLAPMGRAALWTELKGAERQNADQSGSGSVPLEIVACTGSYNVSGWTFALGVFVHKSNPLTHLTLDQLDGIYGAERSGGWKGLEWDQRVARGAEGNIRTWGQAGLTGEWADKKINVYGYNLHFHFPDEFDKKVLKGSYKWNERLVMYANQFGLKADGSMTVAGELMIEALANDPYGIAYTGIRYQNADTKSVPLAAGPESAPVALTLDTVQNRSYPLTRDIYYYVNVKGGRINPAAGEFLRYVLSREAQEAIQEHDGKYLPLTADVAAEQLAKVERHIGLH